MPMELEDEQQPSRQLVNAHNADLLLSAETARASRSPRRDTVRQPSTNAQKGAECVALNTESGANLVAASVMPTSAPASTAAVMPPRAKMSRMQPAVGLSEIDIASLIERSAKRTLEAHPGRMPVRILCGDFFQLPPVPATAAQMMQALQVMQSDTMSCESSEDVEMWRCCANDASAAGDAN